MELYETGDAREFDEYDEFKEDAVDMRCRAGGLRSPTFIMVDDTLALPESERVNVGRDQVKEILRTSRNRSPTSLLSPPVLFRH